MPALLPLIALGAILFVVAFHWRSLKAKPKFDFPALGWLLGLAAISAYCLNRFGEKTDSVPAMLMLALAALAGWVISSLDSSDLRAIGPVSVAAATAVSLVPYGQDREVVALATGVGAGLSALALRTRSSNYYAFSALGIIATNLMASFGDFAEQVPHPGGSLGVVVAVIGAIWAVLPKADNWAGRLLVAVAVSAAGVMLVKSADDSQKLYICIAMGAAVGYVTSLVTEGFEDDVTRRIIMALAWVGVASVSFSLMRAEGITLAVGSGVLYLSVTGSTAGLACIAPAIGLVFVRIFREMYHDAARGLDLGQHYAVLGMIVGLGIPTLLSKTKATSASYGTVAIALVAVMLPAVTLILTGAKGAYGVVVGLALAGLVPTLTGSSLLGPVAALVVAMSSLVEYAWLTGWLTESRTDRIKGAAWLMIGTVALVVIAMIRQSRESEARA